MVINKELSDLIVANSGSYTLTNALKNRFGYIPIDNSDILLLEIVQQYYPEVTNIEEFMTQCGYTRKPEFKQDTSPEPKVKKAGKHKQVDDSGMPPW